MDNNLYLLLDDEAREMVVVDPSLESEPALQRAQQLCREGYTLTQIWNTHGHFDHVHNNYLWKRAFGAPIHCHPADADFLKHLREQAIWFGIEPPEVVPADDAIEPGQLMHVGSHNVEVLHLPGHSPGSVAFHLVELETIISGDVLFRDSVGRTDLPGADAATLGQSLRQILALPPQTKVLPGHGAGTTIGFEKARNPVAQQLMARFR